MTRLFDFLKRVHSPDSSVEQSFSANVNTDVETHNQESQGVGKKIVAKKSASITIDNSTNNIINLNFNDIPTNPTERAEFISVIREAFKNKEVAFVAKVAEEDIQDYNQNPIVESAKEAIEYMRTIAPEEDILCMETGLYVRNLDERGEIERAKRIKDQASKTPRARNIINLASAGFIEGYVVPVCKASADNARRTYNDIVEDLPGIVFVNASMDVTRTMNIIEGKINNCKKYHWEINSISVNGLNSCIDTIQKVRDEISRKYPDLEIKYFNSEEQNFSRAELKIFLNNRIID